MITTVSPRGHLFNVDFLFLAPPAEKQRSFLMPIRPSSVVVRPSSVRPSSTFQLKAWFLKNYLIIFFLFWHVASLGWYQCIVKYGFGWIILKVILKGQKGQIWLLFYLEAISQKLFDNVFSSYARSFPRSVLMHCQKMASIESL